MADQDGAFACSPTLHASLKERAQARNERLNMMTEDLLRTALTTLPQQSLSPAELLNDYRVAEPSNARLTIRLPRELIDQTSVMAQAWTSTVGHSVVRGDVIKALLWHTLVPQTRTQTESPPPPTTAHKQVHTSVTISVSHALNTALMEAAQARDLTRDDLIHQLLPPQLEAVRAIHQSHDELAAFVQPYRQTRGAKTTIRVRRELDLRVREEEVAWRQASVALRKGEIIEVLLWRALATLETPAAPAAADVQVLLQGELAARVRSQAQRERQDTDTTVTLRAVIERYVAEGLTRDEVQWRAKHAGDMSLKQPK